MLCRKRREAHSRATRLVFSGPCLRGRLDLREQASKGKCLFFPLQVKTLSRPPPEERYFRFTSRGAASSTMLFICTPPFPAARTLGGTVAPGARGLPYAIVPP